MATALFDPLPSTTNTFAITQRMSQINIQIDSPLHQNQSTADNDHPNNDSILEFENNPLNYTDNNIGTLHKNIQKLTTANTETDKYQLIQYTQTNQLQPMITLLAKGISISMCDEYTGNTLLHIAAQHNCDAIIEYLLSKHSVDINEQLDINCINYCSQTPLMLAARHNCIPSIQILLRLGASVDCIDRYGCTALQYAMQYGQLSAVKCIIRHT